MLATIYLVRHATPDWSRTDIRYDIPPGPPLIAQGEAEAARLGEFLRTAGVQTFYASPLERAQRTAQIASGIVGVTVTTEEAIAEWRKDETEAQVLARFNGFWEKICVESQVGEPVVLVSHGGPIRLMLRALGLPQVTIDHYIKQFDRGNPIPPAGAWLATNTSPEARWQLDLVFTTQPFQAHLPQPVFV